MLTIDGYTNYAGIYEQLRDIYSQYSLSEETTAGPRSYDKMVKLNTPLFYFNDSSVIKEKYLDDFHKSLLYIGECFNIVPKNKNKVSTYAIDSNEIRYKFNEYGSIPQKLGFSVRKLLDLAFSTSSFRTMCIKAEIAMFLYYVAKSKCDEMKFEEYPEDVKFIIGAISFASSREVVEKDDVKSRAAYVWDLATFINAFAGLTEETERKYGLPWHHVFKSTRRYGGIADFGDYNEYGEGHEDDFYSHLLKFPKRATNIDYADHPVFYIPSDSDAKPLCTGTYNNIMNTIKDCDYDYKVIATELCKITEYEATFLLASGETYASGSNYYFESLDEAKKFIEELQIPEDFDTSNLYLSLMIQDESGKQDLMLFNYKDCEW